MSPSKYKVSVDFQAPRPSSGKSASDVSQQASLILYSHLRALGIKARKLLATYPRSGVISVSCDISLPSAYEAWEVRDSLWESFGAPFGVKITPLS